ncbi:F-box only protein 42 [Haplosporangium gracile]|nr:F-box only protein 42 [Haplosporangium gracile]
MPRDILPSHRLLDHNKAPAVVVLLFSLFSTLATVPSASAAITPLADANPPWRAFHGAAIIDTSMIIFGGITDPTTNPYGALVPGSNNLWVWSTTLRQWSRPQTQFQSPTTNATSINAPSPQKFLASFPTTSQGKMMAFVSNSTTQSSASSTSEELLVLDTTFWTWSIPTSPNPAFTPSTRLGAAVGISNNHVYIHGGAPASNGYASSGVFSDFTKMDDSTSEYSQLAGGPSLMYHSVCKLSGLNTLVFFGGTDGTTSALNNVYTFDLDREVWDVQLVVNPGVGGSVPSARKGHTAVCLNNTMVVYGGGADQPQDDDVWVMDASVTPWVWNRMTVDKKVGPGPRTGHSSLLNGTNMLVWGGLGAPMGNDVNIYILDTVAWKWTSSREGAAVSANPYSPNSGPNQPSDDPKKNNMPMTIGIVCGSLAFIAAFVGFLVMRRRTSRKDQAVAKHSQDNASYISDAEQHLAGDLSLDDKPSYYHHHAGRDSGSSLGGWPNTTARRSIPPPAHGIPMRPLATPVPTIPTVALETEEDILNQASSNRSLELQSAQQQPPYSQRTSLRDIDQASQRSGARVGSIGSDPYYPAHLAENDEEDADRWTFASSLSFDKREKTGQMPPLRYIPSRSSGASGLNRSMAQSTGSLTPSFPANRSVRRDGSAPSILSRKGSALDSASIAMAGTPNLTREGSISPRDTTTLFNSVSPLDRVSLMCSGLEIEPEPVAEDEAASTRSSGFLDPRSSIVVPQWRSSASLHRDSLLEQTISENDEIETPAATPSPQPHRPASVSTSYTSTEATTLDHPAMITLIQNLPARYKVSKSPNPIHGRYNDILYAVDTDTQQPIVIKSFGRRETWERECRTLRRLRGPCVVELKHVATLVLSEQDEPNAPAKIRLTVLERLDETLAEMLQNAKMAKKVALRENAQEDVKKDLDLEGAGFYRTGPALDESYIKDIVKGVLRCLTWCHSKKIVYCDLKPTNIMRNRDDTRQQWKLIDLEASRAADEECTSVGTVRYCAPEVAIGDPVSGSTQFTANVTARYSMDLWAFGCLLFELYATRSLIPISATNEAVLHFLAHPSPETPALANGLRWTNSQDLEIPHFEQAVPNSHARQLIHILLHPDPLRRATMAQVLSSDFLKTSS